MAACYVVADEVGPDLCVVDVVAFVRQVAAYHAVHFFLHERTDVVEHRLLLLRHHLSIIKYMRFATTQYN